MESCKLLLVLFQLVIIFGRLKYFAVQLNVRKLRTWRKLELVSGFLNNFRLRGIGVHSVCYLAHQNIEHLKTREAAVCGINYPPRTMRSICFGKHIIELTVICVVVLVPLFVKLSNAPLCGAVLLELQKTLFLLFAGNMKEKLYDKIPVIRKLALKGVYRTNAAGVFLV